jgi:PAS domain-containing protein
MNGAWIRTFPAEIMVCDPAGTILEMNETAIQIYEREGGAALIGKNLWDHHPDEVREMVRKQVTAEKHIIYTTEKDGLKKLVSIAPWYQDGVYAGFALIVQDLPARLRNIVKD